MKTNKKDFDAVKFMREQRDTLNEKLTGMSNAEIIAYFEKRKSETKAKPCA